MEISGTKGRWWLRRMLLIIVQHVADIFYVACHNVNHKAFALDHAFNFQ